MTNFKMQIAQMLAQVIEKPSAELESVIEIPKDSTLGDYAFPCFILSKEWKKSPAVIAEEIENKLILPEGIAKVEKIGAYLNFFIDSKVIIKEFAKKIEEQKDNYGVSEIGKGKTIIVEYSAPNIAKPFHIGHLRSTVIGQALYNMYRNLGYKVIGINHLGDWGTQFGKRLKVINDGERNIL